MDVKDIRLAVKDFRYQLSKDELVALSNQLIDHLSAFCKEKDASDYLCFYPLEKEVNLLPFYDALLKDGKHLYFPKTFGKDMEFYKVDSLDDFAEGAFHVMEPVDESQPFRGKDGICLVPGLAFSDDFHRVGYGAGFYDRYLKKINTLNIGVCFEKQMVEIQPQSHDVDMDVIVTNERIFKK